jgi:hypothetical protein
MTIESDSGAQVPRISVTTELEDFAEELEDFAEELDCFSSLAMTLEEDDAMTLDDKLSSRELEDRACHELDEELSLRIVEDDEAIDELDCRASLAMTLEDDAIRAVSMPETARKSVSSHAAKANNKQPTQVKNFALFIKASPPTE